MADYYNFDEKPGNVHEHPNNHEDAVGSISIPLERVEPMDDHLNFDDSPSDEFHELDLHLKEPITRIPAVLQTFEPGQEDSPLPIHHDSQPSSNPEHGLLEQVEVGEYRPGTFTMPLTRREYGNEDQMEPSDEGSDFVPILETIDNNGDDAEPESLNRKLERMSHENNYPVPYRSKLTEPFEPGQTLIVRGKTVEDSVRFTISLHTASADFSGNDVPLHISVRFDEGKIVFNTFTKGEWGKEERKSSPWKKGDNIDLRVRAHDNRFTITADQKEIKEYEHRVPLSSVSHFSIDGDVFITHISWSGKYYPVPYESGIPGEGLAPGKTLLIYGTPEKKGKRFHINLLKKNGDIALHFNPRFDEKHIIRNSLISNEWGNEEREGKLPLEKGVGFDLKIVNEEYAFQIFLNEERYATYAHRLEPHDLNGLQIGGDVEITGIQIF